MFVGRVKQRLSTKKGRAGKVQVFKCAYCLALTKKQDFHIFSARAVLPASQMVLQTQNGENHFGYNKITARERLGGASFPYLQARACAPLT